MEVVQKLLINLAATLPDATKTSKDENAEDIVNSIESFVKEVFSTTENDVEQKVICEMLLSVKKPTTQEGYSLIWYISAVDDGNGKARVIALKFLAGIIKCTILLYFHDKSCFISIVILSSCCNAFAIKNNVE